jgi:Ca2+-binding EF-hand superfamily protein
MYVLVVLVDRREEIENEFEVVDLHQRGKLTQSEIIVYLSDKYQWVNIEVVKEVLSTMNWDEEGAVSK